MKEIYFLAVILCFNGQSSADSDLDCEFVDTPCKWTFLNDDWKIVTLTDNATEQNPNPTTNSVLSPSKWGVEGTIFELNSSLIQTQDEELCVRIEYRLHGTFESAIYRRFESALYVLWLQADNTTNLLTSYGNQIDEFVEAKFSIPKNSEGHLQLVVIEGDTLENGFLEINNVRSSWGTCKEEGSGEDLELKVDMTGTDMFYKVGKVYKTSLPFMGSFAKLKSKVIEPGRYCLKIDYEGLARLSVDEGNTNIETSEFESMFDLSADVEPSSRYKQMGINNTDVFHITITARNTKPGMDFGKSEFKLNSVKLVSDENCGDVDCDFKLSTCSWWSTINPELTVWKKERHLTMTHPSGKELLLNEIVGPLTWNPKGWICVEYRIRSRPDMCIKIGYFSVRMHGRKRHYLMTQCGPTYGPVRQCVSFDLEFAGPIDPDSRPMRFFIQTFGQGMIHFDHMSVPDPDLYVNIFRVWNAAECTESNFNDCGWSQEDVGYMNSTVLWRVVKKDGGDSVLMAVRTRSRSSENNSFIGSFWSPSFVSKESLGKKVCVSFSTYYYLYSGDNLVSENISSLSLSLDRPENKSLWTQDLGKKSFGSTIPVAITLNLKNDGPHRVVFSANLSESLIVEIRNFSITDGKCKGSTSVPNCDFTNGLCDWSTENEEDYSWSWVNTKNSSQLYRSTPMKPSVDCSLTPGGFASVTNYFNGYQAHLKSTRLPANVTCVSFCYYMFGVDAFRLEVSLEENKADEDRGRSVSYERDNWSLWNKFFNQGPQWHHVQVPLKYNWGYKTTEDSRLVFTSTRSWQQYLQRDRPNPEYDLYLRSRGDFSSEAEKGFVAVDSVVVSQNVDCEKLDKIVNVPKMFK